MFHGMLRLIAKAKRARWTNAVTRTDGVEVTHEADWIKHMRIIDPYSPREGVEFAPNTQTREKGLFDGQLKPSGDLKQ